MNTIETIVKKSPFYGWKAESRIGDVKVFTMKRYTSQLCTTASRTKPIGDTMERVYAPFIFIPHVGRATERNTIESHKKAIKQMQEEGKI
jgi:hypothetical protein